MEPLLCDYMEEAVILADGRVTTCCMDPLAVNCFANIYEDDFETVARRHARNVERVLENAYALPRCKICYDKIRAGGFQPGRYKVRFGEEEKRAFLERCLPLTQLVIEPSSICNLKCRGCMQSRFDIPAHRNAPMLDLEAVLRFLGDAASQIELTRLYNYGETFLNKGAIPFIREMVRRNPETKVSIATNGLLLRGDDMLRELVRSGVDSLVFSIHGSSQETVEPYMTEVYDFERNLDMLRRLVHIREQEGSDRPSLHWKHLLFEWNDGDEEVASAIRQAEEIGMDSIIFVVPGFPSPSPRYKNAPDKVRALCRRFADKGASEAKLA